MYELKLLFLQLAAAAVTYGFYLCLGLMSTYTLIHKGLRGQRARQALLGITLTMLLSATAHLGLFMAFILLQFPTPAAEYVNPVVLLRRLDIAETCLRRLTYFLSDIIVVWRAWVIWHDNRMMHAGLAVCLLATGATSLTLLVFNFKSEFDGTHFDDYTQNFLGTFGLLVTNFVSTALISYKLWYYRRNVKKYINRAGTGNTRVEGILILLTESGIFYCIFWILLMVGDFGYYGPDFHFEWFQPYISGLYPTIIIFMVSRQVMLGEEAVTFKGSNPGSSGTDQTIWFAPPTASRTAERRVPDDASLAMNSFSRK
ncbi:hypothetical protein C8R44DRAFT_878646 [Mycena epipterygia]|nr:hypothetical protein C8R44DRAFT_878646 [Mycena epipterygia]